jgi:Outer membrane protein beta-barrel domain
MKKIIVLASLFISTISIAQKFELGVKAGGNISNFTGSSYEDTKAKTLVGFHAGAFVSLFVGHNFAIQPEVLLSTQGSKLEDVSGSESTDFKLTYINIPILVKYRFNGGFYLEAGPQVGFKVHEEVDGSSEDFAKSTDVSVAGGLGYHSKIGLGIGARYTAGLSKLGDIKNAPTQPDWKNGVIQFSIFYTFFNNRK